MLNASRMAYAAGSALGIGINDVLVASTGVIGQPLKIEAIERSLPDLAQMLSETGSQQAGRAIMTTDTFLKEVSVSYEIDGKTINVGGIAKGSGMIEPNMCTLLGFITTDAAIDKSIMDAALKDAVNQSFNRISVDGDTSHQRHHIFARKRAKRRRGNKRKR